MKNIFLVLIFCVSYIKGFSQTNDKVNLCKEVENTYQIIATNTRIKLALTSDVCEIVKRERQKEKTIIYKVNDWYSIKIYSEKDIPNIKLPLQYIIYSEN